MSPLLSVRDLVKAFDTFRAVDGFDLDVQEGAVHALIGPNGAGKTTVFNCITGHLTPTSGRVTLGDEDVTGLPPHLVVRRRIARTFQLTNVFPRLTVLESIQFALLAARRLTYDFLTVRQTGTTADAYAVLRMVGLEGQSRRPASELAHGDQRLLEIGLALAGRPRMLLLDEPTAGMSPAETDEMVRLIARLAGDEGLTVLLCEHDMDVVFSVSHRVTVMHEGRVIADDEPAAIRRNKEVRAVYLGAEA